MINYALTINKHSQHHFHIGPNLPCVFGSGWSFWDPMRILGFCFDNTAIYSSFITCEDILYKDFISICMVDMLFTDINTSLFLIFLQHAQHKFGCNTKHAQIFPWESFWHVVFDIPSSSATSWTVKWRLERVTFQTFGMSSSISDVEWCPERSLSTEVQPSLKRLHHSCVWFYSWLHPQTSVLTVWKSPKPFTLIWNKISHKHIAHENHPVLTDKK